MRRNGKLELRIPTFAWKQIGGDMSADKYGGTIAEADGKHIELLKIQPVREYIGEREAKDVGHPFWTKEAWLDLDDLDPFGSNGKEVKSALQSIGVRVEDGELVTDQGDIIGEVMGEPSKKATPEIRALVIAEALLDYGRGDEGPAGWSEDIYPERVVEWSYGEPKTMGEYLADEDAEFRREVLGERYAVKVDGEQDSIHEEEDDAIEAAEELAKLRPGVVVTVEDTFDGESLWSSDDPQHEEREENRRRSRSPNIDADLKKRYEFFKTFGGGGVVGRAAEGALAMARAERIAEDRGWEADWEMEEGPWEDYLGDYDKLEDIEEVSSCILKDDDGRVLASLGGITLSKKSSGRETQNYRRYVEAELALEAAHNARLL